MPKRVKKSTPVLADDIRKVVDAANKVDKEVTAEVMAKVEDERELARAVEGREQELQRRAETIANKTPAISTTPMDTKPPARNGVVSVCVPVVGGVGVIRIHSEVKAPITRHYLLRCVGSMKFSLTSFGCEKGGGKTYIVNIRPGHVDCGCDDSKTHSSLSCKHINALQSLVNQGRL